MNPYKDIPHPALYTIERAFRENIVTWEKIATTHRDELHDEHNEKIAIGNSEFFREQLDLVEAILSGNG